MIFALACAATMDKADAVNSTFRSTSANGDTHNVIAPANSQSNPFPVSQCQAFETTSSVVNFGTGQGYVTWNTCCPQLTGVATSGGCQADTTSTYYVVELVTSKTSPNLNCHLCRWNKPAGHSTSVAFTGSVICCA